MGDKAVFCSTWLVENCTKSTVNGLIYILMRRFVPVMKSVNMLS